MPWQMLDELRKETAQKALAVLTSEQRGKFEKMQGEKLGIDQAALSRAIQPPQFRRPNEKQ
jgi:hypothetical protein